MRRQQSELELRDAVLIDFAGPDGGAARSTWARSPPAPRSSSGRRRPQERPAGSRGMTGPTPQSLLEELRLTSENRPENLGELRLVAWSPRPVGQDFEPAVDRHRGMTAVVVHLRNGLPLARRAALQPAGRHDRPPRPHRESAFEAPSGSMAATRGRER